MRQCKPSHPGPSFRGLGVYAWVRECSNQEIAQSEKAVTACFSALQCIADHRDLLQECVVDFGLECFFLFFLFVFLCFLLKWSSLCFIFHYTLPLSDTVHPLITTLHSLNNSLTYGKTNNYILFHTLCFSSSQNPTWPLPTSVRFRIRGFRKMKAAKCIG